MQKVHTLDDDEEEDYDDLVAHSGGYDIYFTYTKSKVIAEDGYIDLTLSICPAGWRTRVVDAVDTEDTMVDDCPRIFSILIPRGDSSPEKFNEYVQNALEKALSKLAENHISAVPTTRMQYESGSWEIERKLRKSFKLPRSDDIPQRYP